MAVDMDWTDAWKQRQAEERRKGQATAWYIIPSGRLLPRWFNTLHWPYTLWHLSYPAMGAVQGCK